MTEPKVRQARVIQATVPPGMPLVRNRTNPQSWAAVPGMEHQSVRATTTQRLRE